MQCTLNFSGIPKKPVLKFLKQFPGKETKTSFEEFRCLIGESTVTLYGSGKLLIQGSDCEKVKERILEAVEVEEGLVLGIDETGRGEGFGPFVVAAVLAEPGKMRELRDSKKVKDLKGKRKIVEENAVATAVFSVPSQELSSLHEKGINLNEIEARAINAFFDFFKALDKGVEVVVDGNPLKGCRKEISFIVKGDDLNPVVGAASVLAKSERENSKDRGKRLGWGNWGKKG